MDRQYVDLMRHAIQLAETCRQGLEEIKGKLGEGRLQDTMMYFNHIADSFYNILISIQPFLEELPHNNLESLSKSLNESLGFAVQAYEQKDRGKVLEVMQFTLIPDYKRWQEELNSLFEPYCD